MKGLIPLAMTGLMAINLTTNVWAETPKMNMTTPIPQSVVMPDTVGWNNWCGRQAAARRRHGECRGSHIDEYDWCDRVDRCLDRSRFRSSGTRVLLRSCARDPHAALDHL